MTRRKSTRPCAAFGALAILLAAAVVLPSACGSGDKPAVNATTLFPSPSASDSGTGGSGNTSPSSGASASPSPSSTGSGGASGSSGTSTKKITDKSIRGNILVRLSQEPSLRGLQFKVAVHDAKVILTGRVNTKEQKRSAERIAVSEPGVKSVVSYIEVTGGGGY
jgi:hypothetical protein